MDDDRAWSLRRDRTNSKIRRSGKSDGFKFGIGVTHGLELIMAQN